MFAKRLSVLFSCAESCRLLTGAFHVIYLLSTGLEIKYIFLLQACFSFSCLIFEIYSIKLTKQLGPHRMLVIGILLWGFYFSLCLFSPNITLLIAAYIIYGAGFSAVNGSFEQWLENCIVSNFEEKSSALKYMRIRRKYFSLINVIIGIFGAFFVALSNTYQLAYILSTIILFIVAYLLTKIPYDYHHIKPEKEEGFRVNITKLTSSKKSILFIFIAITLSIIFMPILHLWQPLFEDIFSGYIFNYEVKTAIMLGFVFSSYNLFNFLFNYILLKSKQSIRKGIERKSEFFSLTLLSFALYNSVDNLAVTVVLFSLAYCFLSQLQITHRSRSIVLWSGNDISQLLSYSNVLSRIATASIWMIYFNFLSSDNYKIMFDVSILFLFFIYILNRLISRKNNKHIFSDD